MLRRKNLGGSPYDQSTDSIPWTPPPCGSHAIVLRNKQTGEVFAQQVRCNKWTCPSCLPIKISELRDLLVGQLVDREVRYFNTVTLPATFRSLQPSKQAKALHGIHIKALETMARLCAPNGQTYKKRASRSLSCRSITSESEWQRRYEKRLVPERERAIRYDAYVMLHILAEHIAMRQEENRKRLPRQSREIRVERAWKALFDKHHRVEQVLDTIRQHYERAMERMLERSGHPTYYGTYEYHADGKTVHLHSLSNVWISHYALHCTMYGKAEISKRLARFERGEFTPLPHDFVYLSVDITDPELQRKRFTIRHRDQDFDPVEEFTAVNEEFDDDLNQLMAYITKSLEYISKDVGGTMSSLGLRCPDFHSRDIMARPAENDEDESRYEKLSDQSIKVDLPSYRLPLDEPSDGDWYWAIRRAADQYHTDWDAYRTLEQALSMTMPDAIGHLLPLRHNDRFWTLREQVKNGVNLNERDLRAFKRLQRMFDADLDNLRTSILTRISLDRFNAPPIPLPKTSTFEHLDEMQQKVVNQFAKYPVTLVHGPAGTGKSLTATTVIRVFELPVDKTLILAYTGKAADRLNQLLRSNRLPHRAQTIHSALSAKFDGSFGHDEFRSLSKVRYVILDEVGVVPKPLFAQLLRSLPASCRLLFLGDYRQLPPLDSGSVIRELMELRSLPTIELTQNYRSGDRVIHLANAVLDGDAAALTTLTEACDEDLIVLLREQGCQVLSNSRKVTKRINRLCSSPNGVTLGGITYSEGAPVIVTRNENSRGLLNGQMGFVFAANRGHILVKLDDGRTERYDSRNASKVDLAHALTVHKAQGSEFDYVLLVLDLTAGNALKTREIVYTAVTRARKNVGVMFYPTIRDIENQWRTILNRESVMVAPHTYSNAINIARVAWQQTLAAEVGDDEARKMLHGLFG